MHRYIRAILLALIAAVALIATTSTAPAHEDGSEPADGASAAELAAGCQYTSPTTEFPVVRCAWFKAASKIVFDPGAGVGDNWKLGATVHELEDRAPVLGNLIVGNCANHPNAPCIRVHEVHRPDIEWWTQFQVLTNPNPNEGWIKLNAAHGIARPPTCHATARILGLSRHTTDTIRGCTYVDMADDAIHVAPAAMEALRDGYRN